MGQRIKRDMLTIVLEATLGGKSPAQILATIKRQRPEFKDDAESPARLSVPAPLSWRASRGDPIPSVQ